MSLYNYAVSTDITSGSLNNSLLHDEITYSQIVTSLDSVTSAGDNLTISFKSSLSLGDEEILDQLVLSHDGNLLEEEGPQLVEVVETAPFARPDYRTKRDGASNWVAVSPGSNQTVDFILTEDRYVTGGEIIFKNAKEGDYISAEVYDADSVIPEPYRAPLCEAWPSVSKYVVKKWIVPTESDKYGSFVIDTYPLNAKITAGLYLRVTYHSSADSGERKVAVNYHLTKRLV